jgi:hypothetical protein
MPPPPPPWRVRPGRCLPAPCLAAAKPPTASAFATRRTSPCLSPSRAPPELQVHHRPSSIRRPWSPAGETAATSSFVRSSWTSAAPARRLGSTGAPPVLGDRLPPMHRRRPPPPKSGHPRWSPPVVSTSSRLSRSPLSIPQHGWAPGWPRRWRLEPPGLPPPHSCCYCAPRPEEEDKVTVLQKGPCKSQ